MSWVMSQGVRHYALRVVTEFGQESVVGGQLSGEQKAVSRRGAGGAEEGAVILSMFCDSGRDGLMLSHGWLLDGLIVRPTSLGF
jgi:hypothetical protein